MSDLNSKVYKISNIESGRVIAAVGDGSQLIAYEEVHNQQPDQYWLVCPKGTVIVDGVETAAFGLLNLFRSKQVGINLYNYVMADINNQLLGYAGPEPVGECWIFRQGSKGTVIANANNPDEVIHSFPDERRLEVKDIQHQPCHDLDSYYQWCFEEVKWGGCS